MSSPAPLIWFADDWGRHPSSSQYLARQLLPHRRIHWVNTIGTRKPRLNIATFRRALEKLRHWSRPPAAEVPAGLSVSNPRMWPWFSHSWDRWANRFLLARHLRRVSAALPAIPTVITTLPLTADLVGRFPAARWVYYCVDDFGTWPGLDGRALREMERRLVTRVDRVIAVSETLLERLKRMGCPAELLTHGVDLGFWGCSASPTHDGERREAASTPLLVFWGVIDRRLDFAIIRALADARLGEVLLVGPPDEVDPALYALSGVRILPPRPVQELPLLAQASSVLIMPYADLPVTRSIQPLKLKEYLATGRPCVVRDLPANRAWADGLDLADSPASFVEAVRRRLRDGVPESQRLARRRLAREGWDEKARELERMIDG